MQETIRKFAPRHLSPPIQKTLQLQLIHKKRSCDAKSNSHWTEQRRCVRVRVRVSDSEEPYHLSWLFPCPELCCTPLSSYLFRAEYLSAWPGFPCVFSHRHLNNKLTFFKQHLRGYTLTKYMCHCQSTVCGKLCLL